MEKNFRELFEVLLLMEMLETDNGRERGAIAEVYADVIAFAEKIYCKDHPETRQHEKSKQWYEAFLGTEEHEIASRTVDAFLENETAPSQAQTG